MFECIAKWATCGTIEDYGSYSKGRLKYTKYVLTFVDEFGISNVALCTKLFKQHKPPTI